MPLSPSRRWLQFSVRSLLVGMTVFTLWFGWQWNIVRSRRAMKERLHDPGGRIARMRQAYTTPTPLPASTGTDWNFTDRPTNFRELYYSGWPSIPIWRRWMGDKPMVVISAPQRATADEIEGAARLFPEAIIVQIGADTRDPTKLRSMFDFE